MTQPPTPDELQAFHRELHGFDLLPWQLDMATKLLEARARGQQLLIGAPRRAGRGHVARFLEDLDRKARMTTTRYLVARDPATYRSSRRRLPTGWDETVRPDMLARMLEALAAAIAQEWPRKLAVPFPVKRIEWRLDTIDNSTTRRSA